VPYATLVYAHRIDVRLAFFCLAAALAILRGLFFVPRPAFRPPGPEIPLKTSDLLILLSFPLPLQFDRGSQPRRGRC
jgi:hypothetical protein